MPILKIPPASTAASASRSELNPNMPKPVKSSRISGLTGLSVSLTGRDPTVQRMMIASLLHHALTDVFTKT